MQYRKEQYEYKENGCRYCWYWWCNLAWRWEKSPSIAGMGRHIQWRIIWRKHKINTHDIAFSRPNIYTDLGIWWKKWKVSWLPTIQIDSDFGQWLRSECQVPSCERDESEQSSLGWCGNLSRPFLERIGWNVGLDRQHCSNSGATRPKCCSMSHWYSCWWTDPVTEMMDFW